jgi:hypothetical protein
VDEIEATEEVDIRETTAKMPSPERVEEMKAAYIKTRQQETERHLRKMDNMIRGVKILEAYGVVVNIGDFAVQQCCITVETDVKHLPRIRRAFGRVKMGGKEVHGEAYHNQIKVHLASDNFPEFDFYYVTDIKPDSRCRIVTRREPGYESTSLECTV